MMKNTSRLCLALIFTVGIVSAGETAPEPAPVAAKVASSDLQTIDELLLAVKADPDFQLDPERWTEIRRKSDEAAMLIKDDGSVALYLQQIKKSLIDFQNHGGWPYRSSLVYNRTNRATLTAALRKELEVNPSPLLKYALICPTLYEGDKMGALDLVDQLKQEDKFLYKRASKNMFDFWIPYIDKRLKAEEAQAQKAAPDPQS